MCQTWCRLGSSSVCVWSVKGHVVGVFKPCMLLVFVEGCASSVREKAISPTSSQLTAHYPEFLHLVLDCNEIHMGTQAPCSANCVKTTDTNLRGRSNRGKMVKLLWKPGAVRIWSQAQTTGVFEPIYPWVTLSDNHRRRFGTLSASL